MSIDVKTVAREFRKMGARCEPLRDRRSRRVVRYKCYFHNVEVNINPDDINVTIVGELRLEFMHDEDPLTGLNSEEFMEILKESSGAERVSENVGGGRWEIQLEFPINKYEKALKVAKILGETDLYPVLTNFDAELRIMSGDKHITSYKELEEILNKMRTQ